MTRHLKELLDKAKKVVPTEEQKEEQRRSFAYGNTKIENSRITRETVDREAESLGAPKNWDLLANQLVSVHEQAVGGKPTGENSAPSA